MRRGMILLGFWMCICMVFLVNTQEHTSRKLYCTNEDRAISDRCCIQMELKKSLPLDELMIHTALSFRGIPYVASTLEREPKGLVIDLRELDYTTFAETTLALSRTLWEESSAFESFYESLQQLRYRSGMIRDYTDYLRYMTSWFCEGERKGIAKDMGREIGGASLPLDLSFISTHPDGYEQLKSHPGRVRRMANEEEEINLRPYYHAPKQEIEKYSSGIKNGDILCFATSIRRLDVTHVGIVYWKGRQLTFIRASSSTRKMIIQTSSLRDYAEGVKSYKGILVAHPLSIY